MPKTAASLAQMRKAIDQTLWVLTSRLGENQSQLSQMTRYHLGYDNNAGAGYKSTDSWSKRTRPILLLLVYAALVSEWVPAIPAAAAIECVHSFSLIHDDIQDESPTRRGRPAVWNVWGVHRAINAGDALFALAFESLNLLRSDFPAESVLDIYETLSMTCISLSNGQQLDMEYEQIDDVTLSQYFKLIELKTGTLFGLSFEISAILAGCSPEKRLILRKAGRKLGVLFQIQDDFRDLFEVERNLGKPTGQDALRRKKTLPVLLGLKAQKHFYSLWNSEALQSEMTQSDWQIALMEDDILEESLSIQRNLQTEILQYLEHVEWNEPWKSELFQCLYRLMEIH
ncbi:polyprenyl synthetase family protein [Alicyclobacillus tolerans]|uniref:Geranylgeranyl diphosphate synthase type I n=1 Tax=Alicyclobacillus tolerans TaxID=90970 RepID=A0ABT9LZ75_9BACL|nr:polyprenyl synthetase family protein [Alicyclobacillus tengchongensis]MDP9729456.1 geranylgeranyl diphosphate synthase type I [Alicyclobacillus tengchongensis]